MMSRRTIPIAMRIAIARKSPPVLVVPVAAVAPCVGPPLSGPVNGSVSWMSAEVVRSIPPGRPSTAQIPTSSGYYDSTDINASFIGWGPVDDPRFLVYVWLEKPQSNKAASVVAAPIFKQVIEKLIVLMGIPPDAVRLPTPVPPLPGPPVPAPQVQADGTGQAQAQTTGQ